MYSTGRPRTVLVQIDINRQRVIGLAAAKAPLTAVMGRRPSAAQIVRWIQTGLPPDGAPKTESVRLPAIQIDGALFTSIEAIEWWDRRLRGEPEPAEDPVELMVLMRTVFEVLLGRRPAADLPPDVVANLPNEIRSVLERGAA